MNAGSIGSPAVAGYAGQVMPQVQNAADRVAESASRVGGQADDLFKIAARLDEFATRLCGPRPPEPARPDNFTQAKDGAGCAISMLNNAANSVENALCSIRSNLARLGA